MALLSSGNPPEAMPLEKAKTDLGNLSLVFLYAAGILALTIVASFGLKEIPLRSA
jgi:hypothetical protein